MRTLALILYLTQLCLAAGPIDVYRRFHDDILSADTSEFEGFYFSQAARKVSFDSATSEFIAIERASLVAEAKLKTYAVALKTGGNELSDKVREYCRKRASDIFVPSVKVVGLQRIDTMTRGAEVTVVLAVPVSGLPKTEVNLSSLLNAIKDSKGGVEDKALLCQLSQNRESDADFLRFVRETYGVEHESRPREIPHRWLDFLASDKPPDVSRNTFAQLMEAMKLQPYSKELTAEAARRFEAKGWTRASSLMRGSFCVSTRFPKASGDASDDISNLTNLLDGNDAWKVVRFFDTCDNWPIFKGTGDAADIHTQLPAQLASVRSRPTAQGIGALSWMLFKENMPRVAERLSQVALSYDSEVAYALGSLMLLAEKERPAQALEIAKQLKTRSSIPQVISAEADRILEGAKNL